MKRYFFLSVLILSVFCTSAKNPKKQIAALDTTVYTIVDKMPEFPGGKETMMKFIDINKQYPNCEDGFQARIIVKCIVEMDGSLSQITIARSVAPLIDKEALKVVQKMPKWIPGRLKGKIVRVWVTIPVEYRLY
jgi:protein TonB